MHKMYVLLKSIVDLKTKKKPTRAVIEISKYSLLTTDLHCDQCRYSPWAKLALFSIKAEKDPLPGALLD